MYKVMKSQWNARKMESLGHGIPITSILYMHTGKWRLHSDLWNYNLMAIIFCSSHILDHLDKLAVILQFF